MIDQHQIRRTLILLIALVGVLAATWSAAMLIGGFRAAGQLDSPSNPLGEYVAYVAAAAIIGATAVFYYVLSNRQRTSRRLLWLSGGIVALLTIFASLTQTFMVVDGGMGEGFLKGTEAQVSTAWQAAERIDRAMVETFQSQVDHYKQRMHEERETGKGPRYRAAMREHNRLREEYRGVLGQTMKVAQQGRSIAGDVGGVKGYIEDLRDKAAVFDRFSTEIGIKTQNYAARLDRIEADLAGLSAGGWIDRKTLVYEKVLEKLWEMIWSGGTADLGFTLSLLLAFMPDLIQVLCASLVRFLSPEEDDFPDGPDDSDWNPFERVWGESPSDAVH